MSTWFCSRGYKVLFDGVSSEDRTAESDEGATMGAETEDQAALETKMGKSRELGAFNLSAYLWDSLPRLGASALQHTGARLLNSRDGVRST